MKREESGIPPQQRSSFPPLNRTMSLTPTFRCLSEGLRHLALFCTVAMPGCGLLPRHSSWLTVGNRGLRAARLVWLLVAPPQSAFSVKLLHGLAEVISGKVGQDGELGKEGEAEGGERLNVGHREFLARQPQKKKKIPKNSCGCRRGRCGSSVHRAALCMVAQGDAACLSLQHVLQPWLRASGS